MSATSNPSNASHSLLTPVLFRLTSDPEWELEWLDLLSQLEYVGCRKILKAIPYDKVSLSILQHVAEEASHAFLLKSVASKLGLPERSWGEGKLSLLGWSYFSELDRQVSALGDGVLARYPAVAWAIERRVLEVYPVYAELTRHRDVKRVLSAITLQERRHGAQFDEVPFPAEFREQIVAVEAPLWESFWTGLEHCISARGAVSESSTRH